MPHKSLFGPWRYAIGCVDRLGLIHRAEMIWDKPNPMPESVADRVVRAHETVFHFTRSPQYWHDPEHARLPSVWTVPTTPLKVPAELEDARHFAAMPAGRGYRARGSFRAESRPWASPRADSPRKSLLLRRSAPGKCLPSLTRCFQLSEGCLPSGVPALTVEDLRQMLTGRVQRSCVLLRRGQFFLCPREPLLPMGPEDVLVRHRVLDLDREVTYLLLVEGLRPVCHPIGRNRQRQMRVLRPMHPAIRLGQVNRMGLPA